MPAIRIIYKNSGTGLRKDAELLANALQDIKSITPQQVALAPANQNIWNTLNRTFQHFKLKLPLKLSSQLSRFELAFSAINALPKTDINIFLENIDPRYLRKAHTNLLIPNQEWITEQTQHYLPWVDIVVCKTHYAESIFKPLAKETFYTGFTSENKRLAHIQPDYNKFFHLAGGSLQKGTRPIIDAWSRHPEWPTLEIIQHPKNQQIVTISNVNYNSEFVSDEQLRNLQNRIGCHLCLSEAEGFGHSLVEALSAQGLVFTTNAPPMNELINNTVGVLVDYEHTNQQRLGQNFYVSNKTIETKIDQVLGMSTTEKQEKGKRARAWYEHNHRNFEKKLNELIQQLN